MIKVEKLQKTYGKFSALSDFSYEFQDGKFYAIVGKSGSGKSTLLHLISLLDNKTDGKIFYNESDVDSFSEKEKAELRNKTNGFIFQSFHLDDMQNVFNNVALPLIIANLDKREIKERVTSMLIKVGLNGKEKQKVGTLSGGEKQRVAIARAMVNQPKYIFADEPTGNLDTKNGREIMALLKNLTDAQKTVIMVTHNLEDAKNADIIIELADGKIYEKG